MSAQHQIWYLGQLKAQNLRDTDSDQSIHKKSSRKGSCAKLKIISSVQKLNTPRNIIILYMVDLTRVIRMFSQVPLISSLSLDL
jgi:hypothetical protein